MASILVRVAQVSSPQDTRDVTIGWTVFDNIPIPTGGNVQLNGSYYQVLGYTCEIDTTDDPYKPGESRISLKVMRVGRVVAAPASILDRFHQNGQSPQ